MGLQILTEFIMVRMAWQQVERTGNLTGSVFNSKHEAERVNWNWGQTTSPQGPSSFSKAAPHRTAPNSTSNWEGSSKIAKPQKAFSIKPPQLLKEEVG